MKRFQSIAVLLSLITGLLVLLLVSVFANSARQAYERRQGATRLLASVQTVRDVSNAAELLHVEQGRVRTALLASDGVDAAIRVRLGQLHAESEKSLDLAVKDLQQDAPAGAEELRRNYLAYEKLFLLASAALDRPLAERDTALRRDLPLAVNSLVAAIEKQADDQVGMIAYANPFNSEMVKVLRIVRNIREAAGIGRRMVGEVIASGQSPSATTLQAMAELDGRFNLPWGVMEGDVSLPYFPQALRVTLTSAKSAYIVNTRRQRDAILRDLERGVRPMTSDAWMRISDPGLNALAKISDTALALTQEHVAGDLKIANREFSVALFLMLLSISLAGLTTLFVNFRIIMPLRSIVKTMSAVAGGDLQSAIPFTGRQDEIGEFARALCLFRDNTQEKNHLEEELRHVQVARETAEASNRIKTQFLANMSHELRTPLNAILGFSDVMKNEFLGPISARYAEYAGLIHESGEHLLNLVSDLLDIAKIEAGKFTLTFQQVELLETVDYCANLVKRRAREKGVALLLEVPVAPVAFFADPRGFRQILINLLSNAIKFTSKGGSVSVCANVVEDSLKIVVRDDGIGMSDDLLARVGQPFVQASNDPSLAREGTGLGLSLVRAIIAQHGGALEIQSREHIGTVVTVTLPLARAAQQAA